MWNFVQEFSNENELQHYIVQNAVSIKRTEETESGKKVIYRCSKYRKYPECNLQVKVIFSCDGRMTISTSNEQNPDYHASTTRASSPIREIVMNAVVAGLSQIQTRRAIQHQYQGVVSNSQVTHLLNYYRSLAVPDVYSVYDIRSWCHEH